MCSSDLFPSHDTSACDTFRAAAIEQLSTWASKLDVPIIKTKQGHDASAVAFDTISAAIARNMDEVIIDTAGRLQTQTNLNNELKKIVKVCSKAMDNAPHQKLMILDGTQGNSAIAQARAFNEIVGVDGIIVTKLDGTAKGGALFSISNQLELPIFYVGVGEKQDDLIEFSPDDFVDSLLDQIFFLSYKNSFICNNLTFSFNNFCIISIKSIRKNFNSFWNYFTIYVFLNK